MTASHIAYFFSQVPACVCVSAAIPHINYSNWQMATGRLVFWPITNGHTAGLNRASFSLGHFSWRLSHSVTSQDPKQSHCHRWSSPPEVNQNKHSPNVKNSVCWSVCVCVCASLMDKRALCVCVCTVFVCFCVIRWKHLFPGDSVCVQQLLS